MVDFKAALDKIQRQKALLESDEEKLRLVESWGWTVISRHDEPSSLAGRYHLVVNGTVVEDNLKKERTKMNFGDALRQLRARKRVGRMGWNGRNMYLELQVPDTYSKMTVPYIYIKTVQGDFVPWQPSQADMLSDDWEIIGENTVNPSVDDDYTT